MLLLEQRAAQYVRMSTDMQRYSIENQIEAIALYAVRRGLTIVRSYEDAGKSGLAIKGRDALQELVSDVRSGRADFRTVLVYDVSRWGRFQDADESAYYEFLCKEAGVAVEYCGETFSNDGSISSTLLKAIKRVMAGEFSRELSVKVFAGQCRSVQNGHYLGSFAGYGLRRFIIDERGKPKMMLGNGERKYVKTDRTILVPGPESEIEVVHDIYRMFTVDRKSLNEIARNLNARKLVNSSGRKWGPVAVRDILANPKYVGTSVFARTSRKLNSKNTKQPRENWVVREGAWEGIVSPQTFQEAQWRLRDNARPYTDFELLDSLTALWCKVGYLNCQTIQHDPYAPCVNTYKEHFGGVVPAYQKIGYAGVFHVGRSPLFRKRVLADIAEQIAARGGVISTDRECTQVCINEELEVAIVAGRTRPVKGINTWTVRRCALPKPDVLVVLKVDDVANVIHEFFIIPMLLLPNEGYFSISSARLNRFVYFRSKTLDPLWEICARRKLNTND